MVASDIGSQTVYVSQRQARVFDRSFEGFEL
jgi:hypothetical protein